MTASKRSRQIKQRSGAIRHVGETTGVLSPPLIRTVGDICGFLGNLGETADAALIDSLRANADDSRLRVAVFGEFNRGKSTLINAILGRFVLPTKLVPTTGHVTRVVFGASEEVRVRQTDGRLATCSLGQLDTFVVLDCNGRARGDVAEIEVAANAPLLQDGIILIDTPGIGEQEAQTRRACEAIAYADLVLLVLDARQLLGRHEGDLAADWLRRKLGKPVVLIVNFLNQIDEADLSELRTQLDRWCKAHVGRELGQPWFAVNALAALKAALGTGPVPTDDFTALCDALTRCRGLRRQKLQRRSRRFQLLAEVRAVHERNQDVLQQIQADADRVERQRAEQRKRLQELRRRHNAAAAVCRKHLRSLATQTLQRQLDSLVSRIRDQSKGTLRAHASRWYRENIYEAVQSIERMADQRLSELTDNSVRRPEPLTLCEQLTLDTRIKVGDLMAGEDYVDMAAYVFDEAGEMLSPIPVIGSGMKTAMRWLKERLGSLKPDYADAYTAQVRSRWDEHSRRVLATLGAQIGVRLSELEEEIDGRLRQLQSSVMPGQGTITVWAGGDTEEQMRAETRSQSLAAEVLQREALESALACCERELQVS